MICIPIVARRQSEAREMISRAASLADVLELRMDLLADGEIKELLAAVRNSAPLAKVVVTNRAVRADDFRDEERRVGVLLDAVSLGADFIDIELETAAVWVERLRASIAAHGRRTELIVSHHDFQRTPARRTLEGYVKQCISAGAQIVKIVTWARVPEDNLAVLGLIPYARRRHTDIVAFCMGEEGRASRVIAPLLGGLFTFASLERGAESAAGQLTVAEMNEILNILHPHAGRQEKSEQEGVFP